MFVPEYMWPQITRSNLTWLQWSRLQFAVHVWTLGKVVLGRSTPSALFFFLFKIFPVCPVNIYVRRSLFNQSVWDAIKPNFQPHFVFEMKDPLPFCNSRWQHTCWFFSSEHWCWHPKPKILRLLTSNLKLPTAVCSWHTKHVSKTL